MRTNDATLVCDDTSSNQADSIDQLFSALGWEATLADLPEPDRTEEEQASCRKPWVLAIDDDSDLSFSLKVRLSEHGIDLIRSLEGMEGVRYAFATPADAIVLDYEMPDVNGDYVLRKLKDNPITEDIPVIVLTGHKDNHLKQKMYKLGAAAFLTKPVRWEDLWQELQQHVTVPTKDLEE